MDSPSGILGGSRAATETRAFVALAAGVNAPVLITGETGTGKGVLATAIHNASARAARPFIAVNCAGVPDTLFESEFFGHARGAFTGATHARRGLFEQAHSGTLFLDEIGELTTHFQAKLLTTIEGGIVRRLGSESESRTDARVIAATSVDLEHAVADGSFRLDLYHRLHVLAFHLPPLRARAGDIALLARHYLARYAVMHNRRAREFSDDALRFLENQAWPGNIRQLAHAVEAGVLVCAGPTVERCHLPARLISFAAADTAPRYSFFGSRAEERERIVDALRRCRGNKTRTARALHMSRNTLRARLDELGIDS